MFPTRLTSYTTIYEGRGGCRVTPCHPGVLLKVLYNHVKFVSGVDIKNMCNVK